MNKKTNNLILFGIIIFSLIFVTNTVSAHYNGHYDSSYWLDSTDFIDNNYPYNNNSYYDSGYSYNTPTYYQQSTSNTYYVPTTQPDTYVVNNYYYQSPNTPTTNTNTTSNTKATTTTKNDNTNDVSDNENFSDLNNNDQNDGNGITALAINGSGGFMPSSIWQWMLVVILILTIIVISRMLVKKPSPADHDLHAGHPAH
jgi:hypothetical protein